MVTVESLSTAPDMKDAWKMSAPSPAVPNPESTSFVIQTDSSVSDLVYTASYNLTEVAPNTGILGELMGQVGGLVEELTERPEVQEVAAVLQVTAIGDNAAPSPVDNALDLNNTHYIKEPIAPAPNNMA